MFEKALVFDLLLGKVPKDGNRARVGDVVYVLAEVGLRPFLGYRAGVPVSFRHTANYVGNVR